MRTFLACFALLLALTGCERRPPHYGIFAKSGSSEFVELPKGDGQLPSEFPKDVRFVLYDKSVGEVSRSITLVRLYFIRNTIARGSVGQANMWSGMAGPVDIVIQPIEGNSEMVQIMPREQLAPGVYRFILTGAGGGQTQGFFVQMKETLAGLEAGPHCMDQISMDIPAGLVPCSRTDVERDEQQRRAKLAAAKVSVKVESVSCVSLGDGSFRVDMAGSVFSPPQGASRLSMGATPFRPGGMKQVISCGQWLPIVVRGYKYCNRSPDQPQEARWETSITVDDRPTTASAHLCEPKSEYECLDLSTDLLPIQCR